MKIKDKIYFLIVLLLSLGGMILQSVVLNLAYEPDKRLYVSGPLSTALSVLMAVGVLVSFCALFVLRAKGGERLPQKNNAVLFFGVLAALFCVAYFVFSALSGVIADGTAIQARVVGMGRFLCAIPFFCYFLYVCLAGKPGDTPSILLGIGGMAWCIFTSLELYFDMSYALSSGVRIYGLLTVLSMLMFLTAEVRYHAARGKRTRYFAAAFALIFCTASYSVPMVIYMMARGATVDVLPLFTQSAVGAYALGRLFTFMTEKTEETEMKYTFAYYEKLADVNWDDVPKAMVDKYGWGYEYAPLCYARGVYAEDTGLIVKLTCHEQNPRATLTEFMDDVCNDSCMEFFFAGDNPEDYANLEFNALGTQHTSLRKGEEKGSIDKFTEIPNAEAKRYDDRWELTLTLTPKNVLDITGKELTRGAVFHGNFYKCGDQCEKLHYGMWSEVKTEKPSFHQPQFFGELIVE